MPDTLGHFESRHLCHVSNNEIPTLTSELWPKIHAHKVMYVCICIDFRHGTDHRTPIYQISPYI